MNVRIMLEVGQIKADKGDATAAITIWRECVKLTDDAECHKKWKAAKKEQKEKQASGEAASNAVQSALKEAKQLLKDHQVIAALRKTNETVTLFAETFNITDPADKSLKQIWPLRCKIAAQTKKWPIALTACQHVIDTIHVSTSPRSVDERKKAKRQREERARAYLNLGRAYLDGESPKPAKGLSLFLLFLVLLWGGLKGLIGESIQRSNR